MPLTASERAKNYRHRLKQKKAKYLELKRKDRERKARKRVSMSVKERDVFLENHRRAQRLYRSKVKGKDGHTTDAKKYDFQSFLTSFETRLSLLLRSLYSKHTLAKAVKRVQRALPNDRERQQAVVKRIGENLGLFGKAKLKRSQANLSEAVQKQVFDFYMTDSISWQAPGKRDCLTIREKGVRVQYQKRFLLFNLRETHALFVQEYSALSISRSGFANLRPKYVLPKRVLAHRICVCVIHENVSLLLEVLSKEVRCVSNDLNQFLSQLVCDDSKETCMMSNCDKCKDNFARNISDKISDGNKIVQWFQWMNINGRAVKKLVTDSVDECVKQLELKTPPYLWHVYIKRKQSEFFEYMKINADDSTVVCQVDYAENFGIDSQDQIQSAHWAKKYVSIFTAYTWWGGSGGEAGINQEDIASLTLLIDYFGPEASNNSCLIITHCESIGETQRNKLKKELMEDAYFKKVAPFFKLGIFFSGSINRDDCNRGLESVYHQYNTASDYRDILIELFLKIDTPIPIDTMAATSKKFSEAYRIISSSQYRQSQTQNTLRRPNRSYYN